MANFLDDYVPVAERITEAKTVWPDGRFQTRIVDLPAAFADKYIAVEALFFRTADDPRPAVGLAWEPVPGATNFTRLSELQNAETAAWGRALIAAFVADAKRGVASREEVQSRQTERERPRQGGMKRTPTPKAETGVVIVNDSDPRQSHGNGTQAHLTVDQAAHIARIKTTLLANLKGDRETARDRWSDVLAVFGLTTADPIPADLIGPIETATLDQFAQDRLLEVPE